VQTMNTIKLEQKGRVVLITLNRPEVLNALNSELLFELTTTMHEYDRSPDVGCFVITGEGRAFAAGADIEELASRNYSQMFQEDFLSGWESFCKLRTPKIAAVNGYALGGGCELAMMCDLIYASERARFGQPELKLGLVPGMGGSQRLTRLVGKSKAMEMMLAETLVTAETIAGYGKTAVMVARDAINRAEETGLSEGLLFERRTYHALWATDDAKEGMSAFLEKREARFHQ